MLLPTCLPCLTGFPLSLSQVTWMHLNRQMLLTIDQRTITLIPRFSVSRDDPTTWTLHIQDVEPTDTGYYVCQVNMIPVINQVGFVQVVGELLIDYASVVIDSYGLIIFHHYRPLLHLSFLCLPSGSNRYNRHYPQSANACKGSRQ